MSSDSLAPIHAASLAEEVTNRIRRAIIAGYLPPNERLTETTLAQQLGVSRSPVREALVRLERQGLIVRQTNLSAYVWSPTQEDIEEVFSLRATLESMAAERVIATLTAEDFQELESVLAEHQRAVAAEDIVGAIALDRQFHACICVRAQHSRLMRAWEELMNQWEVLLFWYFSLVNDQSPYTAVKDHKAILDALRSRDLDLIIQLHQTLNRQVSDRLIAKMAEG